MEREEVFESNGAKLYGTLTTPNEGEQFPAYLFVHGSFPQTRDGDADNSRTDWFPTPVPERKLFLDEANVLKDIGIATFRYDKRGAGKSEGDLNKAGLTKLVDDARNAFKWLQGVPEVDPERVGILGQSEGTLIGLILASENPKIRYLILQGSFFNNLIQVVNWQIENFWKLPDETIDNMKQIAPLIYWSYKQWDECIRRTREGDEYILLGDDAWNFKWNLTWLREHIENPPSKYVTGVHCPTLLLQGEMDHNTPATEVPLLKEALLETGNTNITAHIFPGLDHSFRRLGHPDEDFITAMKRPLDNDMVEALVDWIKYQVYGGVYERR